MESIHIQLSYERGKVSMLKKEGQHLLGEVINLNS